MAALAGLVVVDSADAGISTTKHNLSKDGTGTVKAATELEVCAFCHTPHGASTAAPTPLWNRNGKTSGYTTYTSASIDAAMVGGFLPQPAGSSLMCLSCHDGTVALGSVRVLRGAATTISVNNANATAFTDPKIMNGTDQVAVGGMPGDSALKAAGIAGYTVAEAATTGYTRLLGTNLSNDHPISATYDSNLSSADGELRNPASNATIMAVRSKTSRPLLPLLPTGAAGAGQVQCATCHDPHIEKTKFLRLNRLQVVTPSSAFSETNDIICLACHDKGGTEWAKSVHANDTTANYSYEATAATIREFPAGTKVWQAACLNCHDTHTVAGARRLLREGTDSTTSPKKGGNSAIEETCFQCHRPTGTGNALTLSTMTATTGVPDIKTEFERTIRMPIKTGDQGGGGGTSEKHDITNADFVEAPATLGLGATGNRHVECTDCHNPHRVIKNEVYDGTGTNGFRTHIPSGTTGSPTVATNGNVASGVLRGMWGVEPSMAGVSTAEWPKTPTSYTQKKGIPGKALDPLTKEYQLCFKCHSDYSNTTGSFPTLRGNTYGGTASSTNGLTRYTNVAAEFASVVATDPPSDGTDQGEAGESSVATEDNVAINPAGSYPADALPASGSAMTDDNTAVQNHRSWHPVMWPTGRTRDERRIAAASMNFLAPFDAKLGTQTMYCSDCHGMTTAWAATTGADRTQVQGPHGSSQNFILKGDWSTSVTIGGSGLCFNCHNPTAGSSTTPGDAATSPSGFNYQNQDSGGGHGNAHNGRPCMRCHVAVPHGWKNKAFLVNLNCVGAEGGQTGCVTVSGAGMTNTNRVDIAPYYYQSYLRVATWRASGNWTQTSCGISSGGLKAAGKDWMTDGNQC